MRDRGILEPRFEEYIVPRNFKKNPVKKNGVHGVATNDADYVTQIYETPQDGKRKHIWMCPVYDTWKHMVGRGFCAILKQRQPTYKDVSVCEEWLLFSNFRAWWIENSVRGWQLDKDILKKGNLVYSPESCIYVPNHINMLLADSAAARGEYPLGVCCYKQSNRFQSRVKLNGKRKHLGYFYTPEDAHRAWQLFKIKAIKDGITYYTEESTNLGVFDQRIVSSLEGRISILQDDVDNGRETFVLH